MFTISGSLCTCILKLSKYLSYIEHTSTLLL